VQQIRLSSRIRPCLSRIRELDPRLYQITVLGLLLIYGIGWLDFEVTFQQALITLGSCLLVQYLLTHIFRLPAFDARSALISGLSLCLLLRTNELWLAAAAATVTIASKFIVRFRGKHVFNPTNFGLVAMIWLTGRVWVSSGQWGSGALFAFLMACLGGLVVNRAARSDVSLAFLSFYAALLFARSGWLGEPLSIPWHRLQNGALLLFTFFMISDPKTTPNSRAGRIVFAFMVALGTGYVHFVLFRPNGLILSLAALSAAVPLIDRLLPGPRYQWRDTAQVAKQLNQGECYETTLETLARHSVEPRAVV